MVPYTLTNRRQAQLSEEKRKQAVQKAAMAAKGRGSAQTRETGRGDSDSDEEPVSFFHLEETSKVTPVAQPSSQAPPKDRPIGPFEATNVTVTDSHVSAGGIQIQPGSDSYASVSDMSTGANVPRLPAYSHVDNRVTPQQPLTSQQSHGRATSWEPTVTTISHAHAGAQWNNLVQPTGQYGSTGLGPDSAPGVARKFDPGVYYGQEERAGQPGEEEEGFVEGPSVEAAMPGPGPGLTIDDGVVRSGTLHFCPPCHSGGGGGVDAHPKLK